MNTGLAVFDTTVQETNGWLIDAAARLGDGERHDAYTAVRAGLHALRDRLPADMVLALSAQLPMLLRGVFLEGWRLADTPTKEHTIEAFARRVEAELPPNYPHDGETVARAVFKVLADHVDEGLPGKLVLHLPEALRELWPASPPASAPTGWC